MGGSHFSSLHMIRNLDPEAFEPLIVLHRNGLFSEYLAEHGIPHRVLPIRCRASEMKRRNAAVEALRTAPLLAGFLWRNHVDIVHANETRINSTWALPAGLTRTKFVWHLRTTQLAQSPISAAQAARADRILCVSRYIQETVPPQLKERSRVVYNPFDTRAAPPDRALARAGLLRELGCAENTAVVGYFANFLERKRPLLFVEAAARIAAALEGPSVFFMFGSDKSGIAPDLLALARSRGISEQLKLMDFRWPVEPYMAACDVMLVPALDEPFGRTLVEATLVGTPLVAIRSGGHLEFIDDGRSGVLVAPDDVEAMAKGALRLLRDPQTARRMVSQGQKDARQMLGIETHMKQISSVYQEIMASDPAAPGTGRGGGQGPDPAGRAAA
jgi:glycosyltransferase involved in cell wall biosynthesis